MRVCLYFGLVLMCAASAVVAAPITGYLWAVPDAIAQNAIPANIPSTPPDVTFQANAPLDFDTPGTMTQFLNSGGAFNIQGPADSLGIWPSIMEILGTITLTNGQSFIVSHDDGLELYVNGIDIVGAPGPSAAVPTEMTYNGPSGTFPFQLVWGQCCGGGSVLSLSLPLDPLPAPEPATFVLISAGLIGIGFSRKIFRRR